MNDPDGSTIQLLLCMLVLVAFSGYFSATETAFSSFNRIRLKNMAEEGDKRAQLAMSLSAGYDRLLSTILVGNNIVNILLTSLATVFFVGLYGSGTGTTLATVVTTVVVLIFGEISPKSLAKDHAESFVLATAPLLRIIMILLYPINWVFSLWKRLLNKLFKSGSDPVVTEQELLTIVDEAEQGGSINEQESELIRRVIDFNDREAVDILIPRVDMTGIPADATAEEMAALFAESGYSRLPVYEETMDHIVGVVHLKYYLTAKQDNPTPRQIMQPPVFVPPTMKIRLLLRLLQEQKSHIAIVSDEYGGTLGMVTMEDVLEELVGEIWDEHDDVVENIRPVGEGEYIVLCSAELDSLMDVFDTETACEASTVSGWVMDALGRIPAEGDTFTADGLQVRVMRMDANRPEEIRVRRAPKAETDFEEK